MSEDPEELRWEIAALQDLVQESRKLLPDLKIVLDLAAHSACVAARNKDLLKQFSEEGSKTAAYMVSVWGNEYPELHERSKNLTALVLRFETWKR